MPRVVHRTMGFGWAGAVSRMLVDLVLLNLATVVAIVARLDFRAAPWSLVYTLRFPGIAENLVFVAASILLQTPLTLWSYSSLRDIMRVALVVVITKVLALPLLITMRGEVQWSRGAFAASAVVCFLFMAAVRALALWRNGRHMRQARVEEPVQRTTPMARVLIVGAGDAGEAVLREFEAHPELGKVVG